MPIRTRDVAAAAAAVVVAFVVNCLRTRSAGIAAAAIAATAATTAAAAAVIVFVVNCLFAATVGTRHRQRQFAEVGLRTIALRSLGTILTAPLLDWNLVVRIVAVLD